MIQEISLEELRQMAIDARVMLERKAFGAEHECVKIYLHWTAGWYKSVFDDYHICIGKNGELWPMTDDLSETLQHTWLRNTGSIGIAMCCCAGANTEDLGAAPPTDKQIEAMAKCVTVLCEALDLPIDKTAVLTHGEAADAEDEDYTGYGPDDCYGPKNGCERWDLEFLGTPESPVYNPYATDGSRGGDVIRGKANWYHENGF